MKNIINILLTLSLIFAFISCSDKGTSPDVSEKMTMFGSKSDSYWVYSYHKLDDDNNFSKLLYLDSTYTTKGITFKEKTGFELEKVTIDETGAILNQNRLKYYISTDENNYFVSGHFFKQFMNIFDNQFFNTIDFNSLTENWCLLAKTTNDNFNILDSSMTIKGLKIPTYEMAEVDLSYNIEVTKEANDKYLDPMTNKLVNSIKFKLNHKIKVDLTLELPFIGKQNIKLENPYITFYQYIIFAEGIGFAEGITPNQNVKFTLKGQLIPSEIEVLNENIVAEGFKVIRYKN